MAFVLCRRCKSVFELGIIVDAGTRLSRLDGCLFEFKIVYYLQFHGSALVVPFNDRIGPLDLPLRQFLDIFCPFLLRLPVNIKLIDGGLLALRSRERKLKILRGRRYCWIAIHGN